jgi:ATP-dependent Clp protease adaptor protein ClpS
MVTIYNNDHTAYEVVVFTLMVATGCDEREAQIETWEAHHYGKAAVHFASQKECEEVAAIISSIGVRTEVTPEWPD